MDCKPLLPLDYHATQNFDPIFLPINIPTSMVQESNIHYYNSLCAMALFRFLGYPIPMLADLCSLQLFTFGTSKSALRGVWTFCISIRAAQCMPGCCYIDTSSTSRAGIAAPISSQDASDACLSCWRLVS